MPLNSHYIGIIFLPSSCRKKYDSLRASRSWFVKRHNLKMRFLKGEAGEQFVSSEKATAEMATRRWQNERNFLTKMAVRVLEFFRLETSEGNIINYHTFCFDLCIWIWLVIALSHRWEAGTRDRMNVTSRNARTTSTKRACLLNSVRQ